MILNVELTTEEIETILAALDFYIQDKISEAEYYDSKILQNSRMNFSCEKQEALVRAKKGQSLYNKIINRITY